MITKFEKRYNVAITSLSAGIPPIQREADIEHINKIVFIQRELRNKSGFFAFSGTLSIVRDSAGTEWLIDGQHRISAYNILAREFTQDKIVVDIDYYDSDDIDAVYKFVNTSKPNDISRLSIDYYKILQGLQEYFTKTYKVYLKNTNNPHKPNISMEKIKTFIESNNIIRRANILDSADFITRIIGLNNYLAGVSIAQYKLWGVADIESILPKIRKNNTNLYLGIYGGCEWLLRIAEANENNLSIAEIAHYSFSYNSRVSHTLRRTVWNSTNVKSECYCCAQTIDIGSFECGHIIAKSLGGATNSENLRAICRECNRDMMTSNLETYKKTLTQI
jgi:hypothetical protein